MNSSPKHASDGTKSRRKSVEIDLGTAGQMLPYIRSIVTDVVDSNHRIRRLTPEQEVLDDSRRSLDWANRNRRYAVHDEVAQAEQRLATAVSELTALGLSLADANAGRVDIPTRINGKPAAYSWQLGEEGVRFWRYVNEDLRRPIPADWQIPAGPGSRAVP